MRNLERRIEHAERLCVRLRLRLTDVQSAAQCPHLPSSVSGFFRVPSVRFRAAASVSASDAALNTVKALSAGAFAGALSRTVTSPLERLKVLKQVQSHNTKYDGIVSALVRMYKEEGIRSYWKGNGTNVARIAPFSAIQFVSFDIYKGVSAQT